jgi:phosphatidate cytidylyltransferase
MEPAPAVKPAAAPEADRRLELRDRLAVTILLIPFVLLAVADGDWLYLLALLTILCLAAWEFGALFAAAAQRPAMPLLVAGVGLLVAAERFPALNPLGLLPTVLILAALTWHLVDYERGAPKSGTDFVITVGGIFYLGWLGRYFVALRTTTDGLWWLLTVLGSVWLADTGAYTFGRLFGRRVFHQPMAPRLSPRKTWEGYAGSALVGAVAGGLLGTFFSLGAGSNSLLSGQTGAVLGALVGLLGPVGDLGVSMFKRQMGVKDSGALLAGHGGALDRIDSWLVAITVGYYFVQLLARLFRA